MGPFDRFNDRAKRVLALAQDEAIRFNHNYIGVEHVLLGLVREGEGVAARALNAVGVDLSTVRSAVEAMLGRGDSTTTPSEITLSPSTKKVIELAIEESRQLGHGAVGTEHLLLGIVREGGSLGAGVLQSLGVELEKVRLQVFAALGQAVPAASHATVTRTQLFGVDDPARRVLALAQNEALGLGHTWIGTEHLVLGLLSANGTIAQKALRSIGVTLEAAREPVSKIPPPPAEWKPRALTMSSLAKSLVDPRGLGTVPTPHDLLWAIASQSDSQGAQLLVALGATAEKVRAELEKLTK